MSEEKGEKKGRNDSAGKTGEEDINKGDPMGVVLRDMKIPARLAKMSVEDAVRNEGILPINPIEVADEDSVELLGRHAGAVYGASAFTLLKALTRDDLPVDKRVKIGMKGVRPLLSMILEGVETYSKFAAIEDSILYRGERSEVKGRLGPSTSAVEVLADLEMRLKSFEAENKDLKKQLKERQK